MKVALVHDHLNQIGGAERVLLAFHDIFPDAPIYTLIYKKEDTLPEFKKCQIKTSFIQKLPLGVSHYKWFLPWIPTAFEQFDLSEFDVVISDSSGFSKCLIVKPETLHICYCHTPTRYLWSDTHIYIEELNQNRLIKRILPLFLTRLRTIDRLAAERVDYFIANSYFVAQRIKKYYGRESTVIYPPVETEKFSISEKIENYFILISRFRPYKRVDLAIEAFNHLGLPLKIIGTGEEEKKLKKMAKSNIEFLGPYVDVPHYLYYLSRAKALIFPQEEDFGIVAVEAMACGRPVIAYKKGGALESIIEGETGIFFEEQTWEALADTVLRFKAEDFDPIKIRRHAQKFDIENFKREIKKFVEEKYQAYKKSLYKEKKIN